MVDFNIPQLDLECPVCQHELNFAIQKDIDKGMDILQISHKYNIKMEDTNKHNKRDHRDTLLAFGAMDYVIRKKAIDIGLNLANYIEKWAENVKTRNPDKIKDADALRAMELYLKSRGELVEKSEVTVKRTIEEALGSFLGEEKSEDILKEEIKKKE